MSPPRKLHNINFNPIMQHIQNGSLSVICCYRIENYIFNIIDPDVICLAAAAPSDQSESSIQQHCGIDQSETSIQQNCGIKMANDQRLSLGSYLSIFYCGNIYLYLLYDDHNVVHFYSLHGTKITERQRQISNV